MINYVLNAKYPKQILNQLTGFTRKNGMKSNGFEVLGNCSELISNFNVSPDLSSTNPSPVQVFRPYCFMMIFLAFDWLLSASNRKWSNVGMNEPDSTCSHFWP